MSIADKTESSPRSWSLLTRAAPYAPIDPRGFGERAELSFSQQGLWALCQIEDVSLAYMLSFAWRLSGPLNADALKRSLGEIVRRHESLRTVFEVVDEHRVSVDRRREGIRTHITILAGRQVRLAESGVSPCHSHRFAHGRHHSHRYLTIDRLGSPYACPRLGAMGVF